MSLEANEFGHRRTVKKEPDPGTEQLQGKIHEGQTRQKEKARPKTEGFYYKTSVGFHPSSKDPSKVNNKAKLFEREELVRGKKFQTTTTPVTRKFKRLKDKKFYSTKKSVADCFSLDEYEVLQHVSAFANHQGGELYYGIDSDKIVDGEILKKNEIKCIQQTVKEKIESMVWPRHVNADEIHKFWKIFFLTVSHEKSNVYSRYVIKISVDPCPGGVFIQEPESYYVVSNSVVKLPFSSWIACLEGSTVEIPDKTTFGDCGGKIDINLK